MGRPRKDDPRCRPRNGAVSAPTTPPPSSRAPAHNGPVPLPPFPPFHQKAPSASSPATQPPITTVHISHPFGTNPPAPASRQGVAASLSPHAPAQATSGANNNDRVPVPASSATASAPTPGAFGVVESAVVLECRLLSSRILHLSVPVVFSNDLVKNSNKMFLCSLVPPAGQAGVT